MKAGVLASRGGTQLVRQNSSAVLHRLSESSQPEAASAWAAQSNSVACSDDADDRQDEAAWREPTPKLRNAATARWIVRFPDEAGTVGWEPLLLSLTVDKPNGFVRRRSVFVVRFCIVRKHLW